MWDGPVGIVKKVLHTLIDAYCAVNCYQPTKLLTHAKKNNNVQFRTSSHLLTSPYSTVIVSTFNF